jgi:site-specific recombinase XerD
MWAGSLTNDRTGKPLELLTVRHHLIAVKTFFRRCWREGWIERDPTLPIVLPQIEEKDVNVIQVRDAFEFFKVNRDHRSIGRLALEAFGGLRYTSAGKIRKEDIRWERRGIEMPSTKHKSRKRKFRQGHPACLWEWLRHAPAECWDLDLRQYREDKREMHVLSRMRPMILKTDADREKARQLKNVWRHSFASYLLAKAKEYAPIAYLMQHARATTTEIYEGVADELDAVWYFSITPKSVLLSWDDFCASIPPPKSEPMYADSPLS